MFILFGSGANRKSTCINTLMILYVGEFFDFVQTFKISMMTNHKHMRQGNRLLAITGATSASYQNEMDVLGSILRERFI